MRTVSVLLALLLVCTLAKKLRLKHKASAESITDPYNGWVTIKSFASQYIQAQADKTNVGVSNTITDGTKWLIVKLSNGKVCLENKLGVYLTAWPTQCERYAGCPGKSHLTLSPWCDQWEQWTLVSLADGGYNLKSWEGTYLRGWPINGGAYAGWPGSANIDLASAADAWERWTIQNIIPHIKGY